MLRTCWLLTSFVAACLLAGAGLLSLWRDMGWSGRWADNRWTMIETHEGNIRVGYAYLSETSAQAQRHRIRLGQFGLLAHQSGRNQAGWRYHIVTAPLWLAVAGFLIPPGLAFFQGPGRRRGRLRRNECVACGYSLAGSVRGRCSECGAMIDSVGRRSNAEPTD